MPNKPLTVAEAGRRGGKARARKHSRQQLQEWARLGGWPKGRPRKPGAGVVRQERKTAKGPKGKAARRKQQAKQKRGN